jgi:hypothetical protein
MSAEDLPENSNPFAESQKAAVSAAPESIPVKLNGIVSSPNKRVFAFHDPVKRQSFFLEIDEKGQDYIVRGFDEQRNVVRLEHAGRIIELPLPESNVSAGVINAAPAIPLPRGPVAMPATLGPNANPAATAAQLDAIVKEVQRRRQTRTNATQPAIPPR